MSPPLFRVDDVPAEGAELELTGREARHAGGSLRLTPGEVFRAGDGRGAVADCEVLEASPERVVAAVRSVLHHPRPEPGVTVVQALPKSERSELAVELATEAGADRIVPWQARRCVSRWTGPKVRKGQAKWAGAALAAAKQSRRPWEPVVDELMTTPAVTDLVRETVAAGGSVFVLHEEAARPLAEAVREAGTSSGVAAEAGIVLIVGPEGGIDDEEVAGFREAGAVPVLLGPEILRTSTAAAVALGALGVLTDRWNSGLDSH